MADVNQEKRQRINLHIYDTDISTSVPADQEQNYREAASLINERINAYFGYWKGRKADKEILYYAMIDIALRFVTEARRNDVEPYNDILDKLTSEIEAVL